MCISVSACRKNCSKSESGKRKKKEFLLEQTGDSLVCLTEISCEHQTDCGETMWKRRMLRFLNTEHTNPAPSEGSYEILIKSFIGEPR